MARALTAALAAVLLVAVPGAGGAPGAETPRRGGTVVLTGVAREEPCLNTFLRCSESINRALPHYIFSTVLPGAFRERPGGTLLPALVEPDVEVTKKRPFTLTYRIRREARWSDGERVSAADFVFTDDMSRSARTRLPYCERPEARRRRSRAR